MTRFRGSSSQILEIPASTVSQDGDPHGRGSQDEENFMQRRYLSRDASGKTAMNQQKTLA